ncbi:MAG: hypothetical protein IAF58_08040, partial [Leptolyngbya sp.]|nr:hypothetical protein [Candidatus Melainabacteria bacterium]
MDEDANRKFELRTKALYLVSAAIFLLLFFLQLPKHYRGQFHYLDSGYITQKFQDQKWLDVRVSDVHKQDKSLTVEEQQDFSLFADIEYLGQNITGLQIIVSGDAIVKELIDVKECRVKKDGEWQTINGKSDIQRHV